MAEFEWGPGDRAEIADHLITEAEREEAFADPNHVARRGDRIRVITAWPARRGSDARAYQEANE